MTDSESKNFNTCSNSKVNERNLDINCSSWNTSKTYIYFNIYNELLGMKKNQTDVFTDNITIFKTSNKNNMNKEDT